MEEKNRYKTKQKDAVLNYLMSLGNQHVTAGEIAAYFKGKGNAVGTATIYRHLEHMVQSGLVKRYQMEGRGAACYQYVAGEQGEMHYHLKCSECGRLFHIDCGELDTAVAHVLATHQFCIDMHHMIFSGRCGECRQTV